MLFRNISYSQLLYTFQWTNCVCNTLSNFSSVNFTLTYISLRGRERLNPLKYRDWLRQFSGCPPLFPPLPFTSTVRENTASHAKPSIDFCTGFNPHYHPTSPPITRHCNAEQLTNTQS